MSSITSVNLNSIGSRILATIPKVSSVYNLEAGLTAGDVIRYDVTQSPPVYKTSLADNAENAEVVGVIESVDDDSLNVVIFGQIDYPSELFTNLSVDGVPSGASGGNDIYFLSPSVTGGIQNLAPTNATEVVKPILQRADDGQNNAVVLNYIGYSIGGEIVSSDSSDRAMGEVLTVLNIDNPNPPNNYVDVTDGSKDLSVSDYPDAYGFFGKTFGYTEKITLDGSVKLPSTKLGKSATQTNARSIVYNGSILSIDSTNNTVTVRRDSNEPQAETNLSLKIDGVNYTVTNSEVEKFTVPRIRGKSEFTFDVNGNLKETELKYFLKVKTEVGLTIPTKVTVQDLEVTNKLTAKTASASENTDLNLSVNNLNTDVNTIKTTLGLS
tara:strand:- start:1361 stop:2506 length:1146 start_codon:yes stop_codon:yes gene_type:complete